MWHGQKEKMERRRRKRRRRRRAQHSMETLLLFAYRQTTTSCVNPSHKGKESCCCCCLLSIRNTFPAISSSVSDGWSDTSHAQLLCSVAVRTTQVQKQNKL